MVNIDIYTFSGTGNTAWVVDRLAGWIHRRDLHSSLAGFLAARAESIDWLRSLSSPDWETTYPAPFGTIWAGDILAAWAAHDVLHMRQLVELKWAYLVRQVEPYGVRYAGDW